VPIDPLVIPGKDATDIDPETNVDIQFTEPIQLLTIAPLDASKPPALSTAIQLEFGPPAGRVLVPYFVRPFSVYDLSRLELNPVYNLPGSGPEIAGISCGTFGDVTVRAVVHQFRDLSTVANTLGFEIKFTTREGPGLVNAPVLPDVVYVGRGGATPGLSVIDLNGFGATTGNPSYDGTLPIKEGNTNFPNNPNVRVLGSSLLPPLANGQCTFNGGSEGVFTLTKDSSPGDRGAPLLQSVGTSRSRARLTNNSALFVSGRRRQHLRGHGLKQAQFQAGGANTSRPPRRLRSPRRPRSVWRTRSPGRPTRTRHRSSSRPCACRRCSAPRSRRGPDRPTSWFRAGTTAGTRLATGRRRTCWPSPRTASSTAPRFPSPSSRAARGSRSASRSATSCT
jgi:hypothetical protein